MHITRPVKISWACARQCKKESKKSIVYCTKDNEESETRDFFPQSNKEVELLLQVTHKAAVVAQNIDWV